MIADVPDATEEQLNEAVQAARSACPTWSRKPQAERQRAPARSRQLAREACCRLHDAAYAGAGQAAGRMRSGRSAARPSGAANWPVRCLHDEIIEDTAERRVITRFTPLGVVGEQLRPGTSRFSRDLEDRAGADHRQLHRRQTIPVHAAMHAQARGAVQRCPAARRAERHIGWRRAGQVDDRASGHRQDRVHRAHGDGQARDAHRRRHPEKSHARAWRK